MTLTPHRRLTLYDAVLQTDERVDQSSRFFLNGWQTWTDSREAGIDDSQPDLSVLLRPIMRMYGDLDYRRGRGKLVSWTYTYVRRDNDAIALCGSLAESSGFTAFEFDKRSLALTVRKDVGGFEPLVDKAYVLFDIFSTEADDNKAFDEYFAAMDIPAPRVPVSTGWTSWYNYYTGVTEKDVTDNLGSFREKELPIDIFQIDDGYQHAVGDWLKINEKFPSGMASVAEKIKADGRKSGLWLAPFICEKKSDLRREHSDWVSARAGFNPGWSGDFYALDFYNPQVKEYLEKVFHTVLDDWGFDMVKLDFLYAAALLPRKDKTRGQMMYDAMCMARRLAGDKLILGCGVPLGSAFGLTDFCRISSDIALKWEDNFLMRLRYRERTSTINALTSTIGRWQLSGRAFINDPDVFILREEGNTLTHDQKDTVFLINTVLGGLKFTSDNVGTYDAHASKLYSMLFDGKNGRVERVETGAGPVVIRYMRDGARCCLIANLTGDIAGAASPYTGGKLAGESDFSEPRPIRAGEDVTLRAYQTVIINENSGGDAS